MAAISTAALGAKLAEKLAELLIGRVNKRAKKQDVLRATLTEVAGQLVAMEARVARLEVFTNMLDTDQDNIPDSIESLVQARLKDKKNSGLELR